MNTTGYIIHTRAILSYKNKVTLPLGVAGDIGANGDFGSGEHAKKAVADREQHTWLYEVFYRCVIITLTHCSEVAVRAIIWAWLKNTKSSPDMCFTHA